MFRLRKWYLDVVTSRGDAFIGYAACARIFGIPLRHRSVLLAPLGDSARQFRVAAFDPIAVNGHFCWGLPGEERSGIWQPDGPGLSVMLLNNAAGTIEWRCHAPNARAGVVISGTRFEGRGYVEELNVTLPPWKFPFTTLRWGRFLTASTSVIWIDWRNGLERTWVFHNGTLDPEGRVSDKGISLSNARLDFDTVNARILRDAPLARTAFPRAPLLAKYLPNGLGRGHETKSLAPATFFSDAGTQNAHALYEVVTWR